jgi:hypothetical protein
MLHLEKFEKRHFKRMPAAAVFTEKNGVQKSSRHIAGQLCTVIWS